MEIPKKPPGSFRPRWMRAACDGTPRDMAPRQPPGISPDVQGWGCEPTALRRSSPFARHRRKSLPPNGLLMGIAPPIGKRKVTRVPGLWQVRTVSKLKAFRLRYLNE